MYKYYLEVTSNQHMLNAYELAKVFNIYTVNDKPHAKFVARVLKEYMKDKGIDQHFYYKTKKGDMMTVYPSYVYEILYEIVNAYPANTQVDIVFDNKTHHLIIKNNKENE